MIEDLRRIGYPEILDMSAWRFAIPIALLTLSACHRVQAPMSVIRTSDPAAAGQLLSGFYAVEGSGDNAWRWTGSDFSIALAPPPHATNGARLLLRLFFPETQIRKLGPITITASIDGQPLAPQTYAEGGSYDFVRDVPACFLDTSVLPVSFSVDPYSPRSDTDGRDLGAVVLLAALQPK
jgi:hypothetical protein